MFGLAQYLLRSEASRLSTIGDRAAGKKHIEPHLSIIGVQ